MSEAVRLTAAVALVFKAAVVQAQGDACAGRLEIGAPTADGILPVEVTLPCAPYTRVTVALDPVVFVEETSVHGTLAMDLPHWPGAQTLAVTWADGALREALPPAPEGLSVAALVWPSGTPAGTLGATAGEATVGRLGFPAPGADRVDFAVLRGAATATLTVPVAAPACGTTIQAAYFRDAAPVRAVTATLPPCGAAAALRLTLPE